MKIKDEIINGTQTASQHEATHVQGDKISAEMFNDILTSINLNTLNIPKIGTYLGDMLSKINSIEDSRPKIRQDGGKFFISFVTGFDDNDEPTYGNEEELITSGSSSGEVVGSVLSEDLTVSGINLGGYKDGDVIAKGERLENILRNILAKEIFASYLTPTLTLATSNNDFNVESGTLLNAVITPTFNKRDGGDLNKYVLSVAGLDVLDTTALEAYVVTNMELIDTTINIVGTAYYDEGSTKMSNLGNVSPGHILAGNVSSSTVTYRSSRASFTGTSIEEATSIITSEQIRSLDNKTLDLQVGIDHTINIPMGTKTVVIAYPASMGEISSVKYVEGMNSEIKNSFTKSTIDVEGTNNSLAIPYNVYMFEPIEVFTEECTYIFSI